MAEYYSIVHMDHIFFIHSSIDGQLGCFHVLAITVLQGTLGYIHHSGSYFSLYMPRIRTAESYGNYVFSFLRNLHTVPHKHLLSIYIPINSARGSPSLHTLSSIYFFVDYLMIAELDQLAVWKQVLVDSQMYVKIVYKRSSDWTDK